MKHLRYYIIYNCEGKEDYKGWLIKEKRTHMIYAPLVYPTPSDDMHTQL